MTTVVADSTPIIYLAKIGRLSLIHDIFGKVFIPEKVFEETVTRGKVLNISDAFIIEKAVGEWIIKERIKPEVDFEYRFLDTNKRLGCGERDSIKLCKQIGAKYLIVDDKEARRVSRLLKITPVGTCGILIHAYKQKLVSREEAIEILNDLLKAGFRIGPELYQRMIMELELRP